VLIKETTNDVIDTKEIGRGSLIWAKHRSWKEGKSGIVENVTEQKIIVRFLPSTQNIENHFMIYASELVEDAWTVRYSSDGMETVSSYGGEEENGSE
jgi:hypothetical protein